MATMIELKCDNCSKKFFKYPSKIGKHNFCCKDCYLKYHSKEVPICTCIICGKEFKGSKYNANKYCSRECYLKDHQIKDKVRKCAKCGKEFEAKTSEDKYCSWECYNQDRHPPKGEKHWNWKNGISLIHDNRDSNEYKTWRKKVYERDQYKCTQCGSKEKLNAHHIKSWKNYPDLRYDINNGITLCEKCHIKLHQEYGYNKEKEEEERVIINGK